MTQHDPDHTSAEKDPATRPAESPAHRGGMLQNLLFNIIIPVLILSKFSDEDSLGPMWSIVVALAFPILYGIYDFTKSHKTNFFSVLGIVSVMLTGGMSLLKLPPEYIAIKEATIPALIGIAVLVSQRTKFPLVKIFLFNNQIMQVDKLHEVLNEKGLNETFRKKLWNVALIVASSFFMSAVLNYILAKMVLVSEPGTSAYSEELGKMTALSFPVIALPSMIVLMLGLWYLIAQIKKLTGLELDDILKKQ